ncbi:MAG: FAD binding domain-containing protein [Candidatus Eisenbacteria bacterium]|nr:FAD binding domain-containing protein [Candidatus Eisenbacteria bacterium]
MRAALSAIEVLRPRGLSHALELIASEPQPVPLAGGTDLFVALNAGAEPRTRFLDLSPLAALRGIRSSREGVTIGSLTTFREIREHAGLRHLPALVAAAAEVGGWQIQNRATLGGNIANASPAGDALPVLLAHEARVKIASVRGEREIAIDRLFTGYRQLAIERDELIVSIHVPWPTRGAVALFRKVGTRRAQSISKVVFCGVLHVAGRGMERVRLAYGSMAPVPVRARAAENALEGSALPAPQGAGSPGSPDVSESSAAAARRALSKDLAPIDDIRSDRDYRMDIAGRLIEQLLRVAAFSPRR